MSHRAPIQPTHRSAAGPGLLLAAAATGLPYPITCTSCHGGDQNPAPPRTVKGGTSTELVEVGAHQLHLRDTAIRQAILCSECHLVPEAVDAPLHADLPDAQLTWGTLATAKGASPAWDRSAATCSGVYCHGGRTSGGNAKTPVWTFAVEPDLGRPGVCGTCHGFPPPPPHIAAASCSGCHPGTVLASGTIDVAGGLHIDGTVQASGGSCGACHPVPGASGAHAVHYADVSSPPLAGYGDLRIWADYLPAAGTGYAFGCGHCHPLDPAKHVDGSVEVELYDVAAPAGSLKALSPAGAAYTTAPGDPYGTCSNVYCHSSGQAAGPTTPVFAATPRWDQRWAPAVKDSCTGCHANPPRHDSGGAGTVTANTHVVVGDDGWELGHFAGLPGPWHTSKHGNGAGWPGEDAAPITCQTCHYETTDPANAGPSGFYYLDTRGSFRIDSPASDPFRLAEPAWQNGQCSTCHVPGGAVEGTGKVLPLRHVNGARDVVFDPRTTVPSVSWFPTGAHAPSRPYWATNASPGTVLVEPDVDAVLDGATWSLHLGNATYDPGTKTCSNVACHLNESRPPYTPLQWGLTPAGWATCNNCHRF